MTCAEVEAQLDLLAVGECDPPTHQAIERHLERCARCAADYAESRRLMALLDVHWNSAGLRRLHQRIEVESRRTRRRQAVRPFVRRFAAVAALVLATLGISFLLPRESPPEVVPGLQLAALVVGEDKMEKRQPVGGAHGRNDPGSQAAVVVQLPLASRGGETYRQQLVQALLTGNLPPPPAVPLAFALKNTGERPLRVRLGDSATELHLDIQGNGIVRIPSVGVAEPAFLQARTQWLQPGATLVLRIDRLIDGSRGRLEYIYLTEPGEYELTARLQLTAGSVVTLRTREPVRILVER
jgi:hypothetical protein